MPKHAGILYGSLALLLGGVLFYVLSVAGAYWPNPTPPDDVGLISVTTVLCGMGLAGLFLRWARQTTPGPQRP